MQGEKLEREERKKDEEGKVIKGKIIKGIAGFYYVHVPGAAADPLGNVYECHAKGIFRNRKVKPLVGDDVGLTILDEAARLGAVTEIFPRSSELIRPAVANVDQAVVIFAAAEPEPNLNLLDRFLVSMGRQQVPVVIVFNKEDLVTQEEAVRLCGIYQGCGYEACSMSVHKGYGVSGLRALLAGKTTVLAGPSGVGKSSLTNCLIPEAGMETGVVSEKIKRGRHTTRHSELFSMGGDTYVMDTPGFSSFYVEGLEPEDLKTYFPEFVEYEPECRFGGCIHIGERECGVKSALAAGQIAESRYRNYKLLYEECRQQKKY